MTPPCTGPRAGPGVRADRSEAGVAPFLLPVAAALPQSSTCLFGVEQEGEPLAREAPHIGGRGRVTFFGAGPDQLRRVRREKLLLPGVTEFRSVLSARTALGATAP